MRAGTDGLAAEIAVEHRTARHGDGRQVATRGAHEQGRRRLIAAYEQDDAIDRIAADRLLDIHAGQITEQHRGRPQVRFAQRHHREFNRQAARLINAALHIVGKAAQMRVARGQFRPRIANADHRAAIEQIVRDSPVLHPAAIHEGILALATEPGGRAQLASPCHLVPAFVRR